MAKTKKQLGGQHMFHTTKYGSEELLPVGDENQGQHCERYNRGNSTNSGGTGRLWSISITDCMEPGKKMNMVIFDKGDTTLKDASHKHMDVSGKGEVIVQEE